MELSLETTGGMTNSRDCMLSLTAVLPTFYTTSLIDTARANGSSPTGHCLSYDTITPNAYCHAPATSVLFDGNVPILTGLDGGTWARDLLTLKTEANINLFDSYVSVLFLFHNQRDYSGVERMELALFICPEWGVSVGSVEVNEFESENDSVLTTTLAIQSFRTTSCNSLVRVCVKFSTSSTNLQVKFLSVPSLQFYVHLAEVAFYADRSSCPPEAVVSAGPATTHALPDPTSSYELAGHTPCSAQRVACPSCASSNILASAVAAIATALLVTLILVPVQIAVCKRHLAKSKPGGADKTGDSMDPVYDQVRERGCALQTIATILS